MTKKGWNGERQRHSMAAKGVKTNTNELKRYKYQCRKCKKAFSSLENSEEIICPRCCYIAYKLESNGIIKLPEKIFVIQFFDIGDSGISDIYEEEYFLTKDEAIKKLKILEKEYIDDSVLNWNRYPTIIPYHFTEYKVEKLNDYEKNIIIKMLQKEE